MKCENNIEKLKNKLNQPKARYFTVLFAKTNLRHIKFNKTKREIEKLLKLIK